MVMNSWGSVPDIVPHIALNSDHRLLFPCLRKLLPRLRSCGDGGQGCMTEKLVTSTAVSVEHAPSLVNRVKSG